MRFLANNHARPWMAIAGCFLLLICLWPRGQAVAANEVTIAASDFSDVSSFELSGNAAVSGSDIRLTSNGFEQTSGLFSKQKINLNPQRQFSAFLQFSITNPTFNGADGLVFMLQGTTNTIGETGGGLGFDGIPDSFGVEFDTFLNEDHGDPGDNHIGIDVNGDTQSIHTVEYPKNEFDLSSGQPVSAWIRYDGTNLHVDLKERTNSKSFSYPIHLATYLPEGDLYVGVTASTGGQSQEHTLHQLYFSNDFSDISSTTDLSLLNTNTAPANLTLSNSFVNDDTPTGTIVGVFSAADPDEADADGLQYGLVPGYG